MKIIYLITFICAFTFFSCREDGTTWCPENLAIMTITVNGGILDNYYTIREKTGDTIRIRRDSGWIEQNLYPVFSDSYNSLIKGRTENFRFQGFIKDTMVVNELFVLKGGKCDFEYVSGNYEVDL